MNARSEFWSGRVGFILATIGSAVGLCSIWKFPYEVGANVGSAFLLLDLPAPALHFIASAVIAAARAVEATGAMP